MEIAAGKLFIPTGLRVITESVTGIADDAIVDLLIGATTLITGLPLNAVAQYLSELTVKSFTDPPAGIGGQNLIFRITTGSTHATHTITVIWEGLQYDA